MKRQVPDLLVAYMIAAVGPLPPKNGYTHNGDWNGFVVNK
jgi:hypothetical protein